MGLLRSLLASLSSLLAQVHLGDRGGRKDPAARAGVEGLNLSQISQNINLVFLSFLWLTHNKFIK